MRIKSLEWLLRNQEYSPDNLHLIAISNLKDSARRLERWWRKKYKVPAKQFEDHIEEELLVEMLEDFYEANPAEIERFLFSLDAKVSVGWDGSVSEEHEIRMQKKFKNDGLIAKYQSDEILTPEEEQKILDSLGMNLPKSKQVKQGEKPEVVGGEFDETF